MFRRTNRVCPLGSERGIVDYSVRFVDAKPRKCTLCKNVRSRGFHGDFYVFGGGDSSPIGVKLETAHMTPHPLQRTPLAPPAEAPLPPRITDMHGRVIHYLRISLTDACNLRCVYCMPEHMKFRPQEELMSNGEIQRFLHAFHALGFDKFRFTGGEPTLRPDLVDLVRCASRLGGAPVTAITTNGVQLASLAKPLAEAGLKRVNVSLDTLDQDRFNQVTRWGDIRGVLRGLDAAEAAGLEIKLNAVVVQNFNESDVVELARLSLDRPWQIRFLEMMPFGNNDAFQNGSRIEQPGIQHRIEQEFGKLTPVGDGLDGETKVYQIDGAKGQVGFISPVSDPFCASCKRVRLTADGKLRLCLLKDDEVDLLRPMREGATDEEIAAMIREAVFLKPWGHELAHNRFSHNRGMSEIGG